MSARPRILGAVLAGGASRRFGSDKALAIYEGRTLIEHALAGLAPYCAALAVCGREVAALLSLADRPVPGLGPLGGLNAALHHAAAHGFEGVLTLGCDTPFLPSELARALIGDGDGARTVLGQPLYGYWPAALASTLELHLATTRGRSIRGWLTATPHETIFWDGEELPNVNTPDDLASLDGALERNSWSRTD